LKKKNSLCISLGHLFIGKKKSLIWAKTHPWVIFLSQSLQKMLTTIFFLEEKSSTSKILFLGKKIALLIFG